MDEHDKPRLTQLQQIDAACDRFEQAWKAGLGPRLETFLQAEDTAQRSQLFPELLRIDYEYRSKAGLSPTAEEYCVRFPEYRAAVKSTLSQAQTICQTELPERPAHCFAPGDRIEEFEIKEELGRGAFGVVYRAWQHGIDREVALKVSPAASHESRTLAQLDGHPGIVRVYDQRQLVDRNLHLVYMELVAGVTLRSVIAQNRADQSPQMLNRRSGNWNEQICHIGAALAEALDHAHRKGFLHCDIKPANIMLDSQGTPKLLDFNVAHRTHFEPTDFGGTLAYMSAEQFEAYRETDSDSRVRKVKALDGRSDVYSLAVVLWELATGARPFEDVDTRGDRTSTLQSLSAIRQRGPAEQALSTWPAEISAGLRQVLVRCLSPQPADRFATAGELARQFRSIADPQLNGLLYPAPGGWQSWVLRRPLVVLILLGVLCNVLPCVLNIYYNGQIVASAGKHSAGSVYQSQVVVVNTAAYLLAILTSLNLSWSVAAAVRKLQSGDPSEVDISIAVRCLRLGHYGALVVLGAWSIASPLWGLLIKSLGLELSQALHVVASVFLSGMIAAALTFFAETLICVRVLLPRLIRGTRIQIDSDLSSHLQFYLGLLLFCPFAAILVLVLATGEDDLSKELLYWLLGMGAAGICVGLLSAREIRRDLELLSRMNRQSR